METVQRPKALTRQRKYVVDRRAHQLPTRVGETLWVRPLLQPDAHAYEVVKVGDVVQGSEIHTYEFVIRDRDHAGGERRRHVKVLYKLEYANGMNAEPTLPSAGLLLIER